MGLKKNFSYIADIRKCEIVEDVEKEPIHRLAQKNY